VTDKQLFISTVIALDHAWKINDANSNGLRLSC